MRVKDGNRQQLIAEVKGLLETEEGQQKFLAGIVWSAVTWFFRGLVVGVFLGVFVAQFFVG